MQTIFISNFGARTEILGEKISRLNRHQYSAGNYVYRSRKDEEQSRLLRNLHSERKNMKSSETFCPASVLKDYSALSNANDISKRELEIFKR